MPDLVIIGGGIVGSSAAFEAVGRGADVVLVEAGLPGQATTAGAGIVSPVGLDRGEARPQWTALVTECVGYYRRLLAQLDELAEWTDGPLFRTVGEILIAVDHEDRDWLQTIAARLSTPAGRAAHGLTEPTATMTGADITSSWPEMRDDLTGLFIPEVGRVEGGRLAARLRSAAQLLARRGTGRLTRLTGVGSVEVTPSGSRVRVGAEALETPAVVLAAGSWLGADPGALGLNGTVRPAKGQIVHLEVPGPDVGGRPVINTRDRGYLLGFDQRVTAGATHEQAGFDTAVTAGGQAHVLTQALALAPGLGAARLIETRTGLRPTSPDGLPLIGATELPGVYLANGLGSWGLTLGPLLGGLVARQALGTPLDDRFEFLSPTRLPHR